jgi:hypothetical protein
MCWFAGRFASAEDLHNMEVDLYKQKVGILEEELQHAQRSAKKDSIDQQLAVLQGLRSPARPVSLPLKRV